MSELQWREMKLIESGGAVFRGKNYYVPTEVWSVKDQKWKSYKGSVPKAERWGEIVTEEQAKKFQTALPVSRR